MYRVMGLAPAQSSGYPRGTLKAPIRSCCFIQLAVYSSVHCSLSTLDRRPRPKAQIADISANPDPFLARIRVSGSHRHPCSTAEAEIALPRRPKRPILNLGLRGALQGPDPCNCQPCPLFAKRYFKPPKKKVGAADA